MLGRMMHRAAIAAIVTGLVVGIIGGLVAGQFWLGVGVAIVTGGLVALWGFAVWKNPSEVLKAEADVEAMASGYPPRVDERMPQSQIASAQIIDVPKPRPANDAQPTKR